MSSQRKTFGISSISITLLVVGVLIVVNLISTRFFGRADLTQGKIYSLSVASRGVTDNLQDPLIARAYISADLPANLLGVRQYLLDLLAEYRAYGHGRFQFEVINPSTPEDEQEAQAFGIAPFQANVFQQDKVEMKRVFLGLAFIHGDRQEAMAAITSTAGLEYQLTSAIRRVTRQSLGSIGILANAQGPTLESGLARLRELVGQEYRIRSVSLDLGPVPADITVLGVIGPQSTYSDTVLYHLDQYVMRGGPVLFLLDGAQANMQSNAQQGGGLAFPVTSSIDTLAQFYGAAPTGKLVVDSRHRQIRAMQSLGFIQLPVLVDYPFFVAATPAAKDHVLGSGLSSLDLLFVSPLNLTPQTEAPITVLARSSDKSGARNLPTMIMPPVQIAAEDYSAPAQPLAVAIEGILESYFADSLRPAPPGYGPGFDSQFNVRSPGNRVLVVGDADLASDQGLSQFNQVFLLNAFDWLAHNDVLIALRARQVQDRPLEELDSGTRARIKWANLLGPSFLVIIFGLVRWRRRAASRRSS